MPADALNYALCAQELNKYLSCGKINKISMPQQDTLILSVRADKRNFNLLLSANPSCPRIHLTNAPFVNPPVPSGFVMHLRKHIGNGSIEEVCSVPYERVVIIRIKAYNELMEPEQKNLVVEIMGKHSNIILINQNGIISDSIKHITFDISGKRQILSGLAYKNPPKQSDKITVADQSELKKILLNFSGGNLEKYLSIHLSGLAMSSIKEAVYRALGFNAQSLDLLDEKGINNVCNELIKLYDFSTSNPCVLKKDGKLHDFFIYPYKNIEIDATKSTDLEMCFIFYKNINEAMDAYYLSLSADQVRGGKKTFLLSLLKHALSKNRKKLGAMLEKQQDCEDFDDDRKKADLILSNIHNIRKGDSEIEVDDFYNNCEKLRIRIDSRKTPQANAQLFYKSYNKKKTALEKIDIFSKEVSSLIEYLDDILYFTEVAESEKDFIGIEDELTRLGFLKRKPTSKKVKDNKQQNDCIVFNGINIFIGKNSTQNDELVRKSPPDYIWMHASNIHGSHVLIENNMQKTVSDEVLLFAAQCAAYYSKAKQAGKVPIDYTFVKNVKKIKGAPPGKVIYTAQKTLYVQPKKPELSSTDSK